MKRCIDAAVELQSPVVTFHPTARHSNNIDKRKSAIVENVNALLWYSDKAGVSLTVENLLTGECNHILSHSLNAIPHPRYGLCYDSSHDNLTANPLAILQKYRHRLWATHISDNYGQNDDHVLPFEGVFDWKGFSKTFPYEDYPCVILLEVEMGEPVFKQADIFVKETFRRARMLQNKKPSPALLNRMLIKY